jgi:hypothetical protein
VRGVVCCSMAGRKATVESAEDKRSDVIGFPFWVVLANPSFTARRRLLEDSVASAEAVVWSPQRRCALIFYVCSQRMDGACLWAPPGRLGVMEMMMVICYDYLGFSDSPDPTRRDAGHRRASVCYSSHVRERAAQAAGLAKLQLSIALVAIAVRHLPRAGMLSNKIGQIRSKNPRSRRVASRCGAYFLL